MTEQVIEQAESPREEQERLEQQLERLLAEAKAKHRRALGWIDEDFGPLVFHRPTSVDMKRFVSEVNDDSVPGAASAAAENLVLSCAYYPERKRMAAILDELPGIAFQVGVELQKLSCATGQVRGKGSRLPSR